jgi:hypothetical protein
MKKLLLIAFLVFGLPFVVSAQTWHPVNQVTVGWDAVNLATGYKIFIKSVDGTIEKEVGVTAELSYTITFQEEGRYFLGVQSVREIDEEIFHSVIVWSDNPEVCANGEAFGAIYYELPDTAGGLKVE